MTTADIELTPLHPNYPIGVRAMARPADRLWLRGQLADGRKLGIVGTRRATAPALEFTRVLAEQACAAGWSVWSGGAAGIDTAAHEGALRANGRTVVVMGTGFDNLYPSGNETLFARIVDEDGGWLSPFPPDQRGTKWTFLARNELLASLVDDLVIVQAPLRSGARSTAAAARRMGKTVWAVPASPWDAHGAGCLAEISMGALALTAPSQLTGRRARAHPRPRDLTETERSVVTALGEGPANLDAICERTGLRVAEATAAALTLTLKHVLLESADGSYHLNSA